MNSVLKKILPVVLLIWPYLFFVSYVTKAGTEMLMVPGMVFTIEPMVNAGTCEIYIDDEDGWTVYTEDGKDSAQWEVTVAVTEDGYEILTY